MGRSATATLTKGTKKVDGRTTTGPAKRATAASRPPATAASRPPVANGKAVAKGAGRKLPAKDVLQDAAEMFKKLGDPTRLAILHMLKDGEMYVGDLCKMLDQTQPAVSHHLALLKQARVVRDRRQGKNNFYRLVNKAVAKHIEGLEELAASLGQASD